MPKLSDFRAVIFDMDGLVLDTETGYLKAWQHAAAMLGVELPDEFCQSMIGLHGEVIRHKLMAFCGGGFDLAKFSRLSTEHWREQASQFGIPVKTGFYTLLEQIKQQGLPYALATNSAAHNARYCLSQAGLDGVFELILTRDDVALGKPEPDIFLKAARLLNVAIEDCLVIEDSHPGITAARKAGAFAALVPSVRPVSEELVACCQLQADDLDFLAKILK
ncbi:MAG: haloacid dehalogenase [Methylobacter sp.]|nr:MAG: haloacid dehalogenase [Methylobacter sp.]PPD23163.1 MAG: haloacid dehalogenase [Methylobacter sp.]